VIELLANVALTLIVLLAVGLCVFMPLLVFAAIKDLKNRGEK